MTTTDRGQVNDRAAEIYEELFVPALFGRWGSVVGEAAGIAAGDTVLDVACGTGVAARAARPRVGPQGRVVGVDVNPGMLSVARRASADVEWRSGDVASLPFADGEFDVVLCQFGLMFFEDRARAVDEMSRVLRPGGRLAAAVWAAIDRSPGYAALAALVERVVGPDGAARVRAPFVLGDPDAVSTLLRRTGLADVEARVHHAPVRFPSLLEWMRTEVRGWTLDDLIDDAAFDRLTAAAEAELAHLVGPDGTVEFDGPAVVVTARRR